VEDLHDLSARALAARVRDTPLSAREAALHFIARVERLNPALNALVGFAPARVLAEAGVVDARLSAGEHLPLAGVPFTVKDNLWVQGYGVQQGSRLFDGFVAPRDAWAVAQLRAFGGVMLGITNCSEFACKGVTTNPVYGPTRHPLNPQLTPGGSSGGAAAALAAGLGLLALGTDAGGSIRRPAAHCGLVGFKPSPGLVPHPWGFAEPNFGLSVVGLLARDVADCAWAYDLLARYDGGAAGSPPLQVGLQVGDMLHTLQPGSLRMGWSPRLGCDFAIDADVLAALQQRIDALREAGWQVTDADPAWPAGTGAYALLKQQHAGLHALYGHRLATERALIDPDLVAQIETGAGVTPDELAELLRLRQRISAALDRYFEQHDLLLCPTAPVTAWPLTELGPPMIGGRPAGPRGHAVFTPLFNYAGVPALSLPVDRVRGLPVGLQLVAPRFEDARVLRAAAAVESLMTTSLAP
jgi:aspartyl-tRNA(Asn)/glutamyl-tRNA(Gln) amidotransferase subunit A